MNTKSTPSHPWFGVILAGFSAVLGGGPWETHGASTVRFTESSSTVSEGQGFKRLYVQASPAPASELVVQLGVQFGAGAGAARASDFINCAAPCVWVLAARIPAGQTDGYYDLPINNDTLCEFQETATFTIVANNSSYTIGSPSAHVITLLSDPSDLCPTVSFRLAASSATEGTTAHWVDVQLSGPTGKEVTVNWARAVRSTATSPGDFTPASGSLTFPADELINLTRSFTLNIAADTLTEPAETAVLELSNPANASLGSTPTHTVTIRDESVISWAVTALPVAESVGTVQLRLIITPPSPEALSLDIVDNSCCGNLAQHGRDHTFQNLSGYVIPANAAFVDIAVPIVDDALDESDEHFQLFAKNPTRGRVLGPGLCEITILDNDPMPAVSFAAATSTRGESTVGDPPQPNSAFIQIDLSAPSGREVRVPWSVLSASTATRPADYDFSSGNPVGQDFVFAPGVQNSIIVVNPIVPDIDYEPNETVQLELGTPVNATLGTQRRHTLTIEDDDNVVWLLPQSDKAVGVAPSGHRVRFRKAAPGLQLGDINQAEALLGHSLPHSDVAFEVTEQVPVINYVDAITDPPPQGQAGNDRDIHSVPGTPTFAAGDVDHFAMESIGYLSIPEAGHWTFTVRSDDGFRLRMGANEAVVMEFAGGRAPADSVVTVHVPRPGLYRYRLTYFEIWIGAQVEFLARGPGQPNNKPVGDPSWRIAVTAGIDDPPVLDPEPAPFTPGPAGHNVRFYKSSLWLDTLDDLLTLLDTFPTHVTAEAFDYGVGVINYLDNGGDGYFATGNRAVAAPPLGAVGGYPGSFNAAGDDDFGMWATGFIHIPAPGIWNFGVHSDDGFRLRLGRNLELVSQFAGGRAPAATEARVCVPAAGYYRYELLYFQGVLGAEVEFYANGPGQATARLVGDPGGTLRVYQYGSSPTSSPVAITPEPPERTGANPGHRVQFRKAAPGVLLYNTLDAETLLGWPAAHSSVAFDLMDNGVAAINYVDGATDLPPQGVFPGDRDIHEIPGSPRFAPGDVDDYAMKAMGWLEIPTAGLWRFSVFSDDGFRLRLGTERALVMEFIPGRAPAESLAAVSVPRAGLYPYELIFVEEAGNSQVEFFARPPGGVDELVGAPDGSIRVYQDTATPPCVDLPGGLVAWWKAEGNAHDVYGRFPGSPLGGANFAPGRAGQAFNFDGVNDYVLIGASEDLKVTGSAITMAAWIYPTGDGSPTHGGVILSKEGEYFLVRRPGGSIDFAVANTSPGWTGQPSGFSAPLNTWTHLVFVYDGTTSRLYGNGVQVLSQPASGPIRDGVPAYNELRIGHRQQPGYISHFQGRIDEVAVFRRALTATEVRDVHDAGSVSWCVPPSLRIVGAPQQPEARWPHPSTGYQLQVTDRPENPASWTAVPPASWVQDAARGEWTYRDPSWSTPGRKRFYRLCRP